MMLKLPSCGRMRGDVESQPCGDAKKKPPSAGLRVEDDEALAAVAVFLPMEKYASPELM